MSLNRSTRFSLPLIGKSLLVVCMLMGSSRMYAQDTNLDTPNLSFENGSLEGWEQYLGGYYMDPNDDSTYKYTEWTPVINSENIEIVNGDRTSQDPVISCWDLPTNPDGITPVRVGANKNGESYTYNQSHRTGGRSWAQTEKLVYSFVVTENTTLLSYRFAVVLHCPDLVKQANQRAEHSGNGLPTFSINIVLEDTVTGLRTNLPCGNISVRGDSENRSSLKLVKEQSSTKCTGSSEGKNQGTLEQFAYRPWSYGNLDLSNQIGKKVTITIINHDCLREVTDAAGNPSGVFGPGSHRAYGYFWAETKKLNLKVKNCGLEDAIIEAPEGFSSYEWYRKEDQMALEVDPTNPRKAIVRKNQIDDNITYCCKMSSAATNCSPITLTTKLRTVGVGIDFTTTDGCDGMVDFKAKFKCDGDNIVSYKWDFGDGTTSNMPDPEAHYMKPGEYDVKVTVGTQMQCTDSFTKRITVRYFPKLEISAFDSVCSGESVTLTALQAAEGSTYLWNTGDETQTITIDSMKNTQSFNVTVTDTFGCQYEKNILINVKPVARFTIVGDAEVCQKDTATLTAIPDNLTSADNVLFIWNTNDSTPQIKVCPLYDNMIYTAIAKLHNGCSTKESFAIKVNPLPYVQITGTSAICKGENAEFTAEASNATGEVTYVWKDLFNGVSRTESPDTTSEYTVYVVDENHCQSAPATHKVRVKNVPGLVMSGDTLICEGFPTKLSVTGASSSTLKWYDGTTGVNTITRVPTQDTTYWVEGQSNGCLSKAEISIKLLETPSIYVDGNTSVCPGQSIVLRAHGAHHYKWGNGQEGDTLLDKPTASGTYMVYGYSKENCEVSELVNVTVNQLPLVYTEGDHQACLGSMVEIEAFDANENTISYSWSTGSIGKKIIPKITKNEKFWVVAQNKFGCVDSVSHEVSLTTPPSLTYTGKTTVCLGESVTLQGGGALAYSWNDGKSEVSGPSYNFTPTGNTRIRLTGYNVSNCPSDTNIQIGVVTPPTLFLMGDSAVCLGDEFTLVVSGADHFKWNTGDETNSITYKLNSATEYTVYGTDDTGCSSSVSKMVKVRPAPILKIRKGEQSGCQNRPDTINLYAEGADIYQWSAVPDNESVARNGYASHLVATISESTHFSVEGIDEFGCKGYADYDVDLLPRQDIQFTVYPTFIEEGSSNVRFSGVSPKDSKWIWEADDNSGEIEGMNTSHYFDPSAADSFVVKVRAIDEFGCEYTGKQTIFTWLDFWAPEGFTPNGDDMNDAFKFYGGEYMDEFEYIIFNRLGEIVFTGHSITDEWDGTVDGEPCPWGVYGWYCKYKSNYMGIDKQGDRKGFVSLIR